MSDFLPAVQKVLSLEGGYQDHPGDQGNYNSEGTLVGTNFGISASTAEEYFGWAPTKGTMESLTVGQAQDIYKELYWDYYNIGSINNQSLATHILDLTVLHGRFMWIINRALIAYGINVSLTQEWNSTVRQQINSIDDVKKFNNLLVAKRKEYFDKLVADNPVNSVFITGWYNRADAFDYGALGGTKKKNWWPVILTAAGGFFLIPIAIRENKKKKKKR